jgi:hypothetical protein
MFTRPTTMAAAFIAATAKSAQDLKKVDHQRWVPRRVALNCERQGFAVVTEYDHTPKKSTPTLSAAAIKGINAGIEELVELGAMQRMAPVAGLTDAEVVGID